MSLIVKILAYLLLVAASFGLVCIGVLLFSLQFGFEWSFLLCVCVWIALAVARFIFGGANGKG